jgi:DNA-binding FadR family transcriptional regulator
MIEITALDLLEEKGVTELPTAAKALREAEALRTPNDNDRDEFLVFREKITDFHARLVMDANNSRLSHYYQTLYFSLARYQYLHIQLNIPEGYERPTETHHKILALVNAGRHQDAKVVLLDHLRNAQRTQEDALRKRLVQQL